MHFNKCEINNNCMVKGTLNSDIIHWSFVVRLIYTQTKLTELLNTLL